MSILTTPEIERTILRPSGENFTYVIVRTIRSVVDVDQADTVAMVYGPYDQQGAQAAYRKLVAAGLGDGASKLHVRGLFPTGDSPQ